MLKKNDFIEVEYTGSLKEDGSVFDTTDEKTAKDSGIYNSRMKYSKMTICIGQGQMIPGLDNALVGKEAGQDYTIEIPTADAFGRKDASMIQLISLSKFKKANIQPLPGLQVNIDNQMGIVRTVSGGRCLVDFNHPLSGKDVVYKIKVAGILEDPIRKVSSLVGAMLQIDEPKVEITEGKATVTIAFELAKEVADMFSKKLCEVIPDIKEVSFVKEAVKEAQ